MTTLKAKDEFVVGKHSIGWIGDFFKEKFIEPNLQFQEKTLGSFQTLSRPMTNAEIESELKPGLCELGDVLAFLKNPPEGTKDGNWNLFYTASYVVSVFWDSSAGRWRVRAWDRDGSDWSAGDRVFSPATVSKTLDSLPSVSSDTLSLGPFETEVIKQLKRIAVALEKSTSPRKK